MSVGTQSVLAGQVEQAVQAAGLTIVTAVPAVDFSGNPTTQFTLARAADTSKTQLLELSDGFNFSPADLGS